MDLSDQIALMRASFFNQGYLDDLYEQLEDLQGEDKPNFVEDTMNLFFTDSTELITNMEVVLRIERLIDFDLLYRYSIQLKDCSSSVGAMSVKNFINRFQNYCNKENVEGCKETLEKLKIEHKTLKDKFQTYFDLKRQFKSGGDGASSSK